MIPHIIPPTQHAPTILTDTEHPFYFQIAKKKNERKNETLSK